ncbi:MAG TPA: hypothetical protein PLL98_07940 [Bacillota bacterium]|nr:hypothetical protein [Bacillota bacterium]HOR86404.1 hypothetical protein [Bacillota bacterium]HPL54332.1 hypothetical protein [Bacillota bacterium]
MFRKKKNYLKQIYKMNPETNAYIIEISLDDYNEIFNGWDPSPIKRRDLDPDMVNFMELCSSDIPLKYPLELQFYMPEDQYSKEKEDLSIVGIKNNYDFTLHFIKKELTLIREKIALYIMMAVAFLSVGYFSGSQIKLHFIKTILKEGLSIGGWVFLWEAFSLFFFSRQEVYNRLKTYRRFQNTKISFKYKQ